MAGLSPAGLTLDTGALLALERNRRDMVKLVAGAREIHRRPLVPANVLAEWWRGRSDRRVYVRNLLSVQDMNEEIAKLAGEALAWLGGDVDGKVTVDATVMATAAIYAPNLYTGDFDDMDRFSGFFPSVKLFGLTR